MDSIADVMRAHSAGFDEGWFRAIDAIRFAHKNLPGSKFGAYLESLYERAEQRIEQHNT